MSDREKFERFTKPLYDKLRDAAEDLGWQWLVRDRKPEFFVWNASALAHVSYIRRNDKDWLFVFLSNGQEQVSQVPEEVFEMVFGALTATAS